MVRMNSDTARLAIEAMMRIVGEANGVEIETKIKEKKHDE